MKKFLLIIAMACLAACQKSQDFLPEPVKEDVIVPLQANASTTKYTAADADYFIESLQELIDSMAVAQANEVVFIKGDLEFDIDDIFNISTALEIPAGVILASDRNHNGSLGAKLYQSNTSRNKLIVANGDNVEISGLRISGAIPTGTNLTTGIRIDGFDNLNVNNCEVSGFYNAGISLTNADAIISNNYIHSNLSTITGYGILLIENSYALIEKNLFDRNNHDISGTGHCPQSYEARYNLVLTNGGDHSFDMHCAHENGVTGSTCAGDNIYIHHNTFKDDSHEAIMIRAIPGDEARIEKNIFYHNNLNGAIKQFLRDGTIASWPQSEIFYPFQNINLSGNVLFNNINGSNHEDVILLTADDDLKKYPFDGGDFFDQDLPRVGHSFTFENYFVGQWQNTTTSSLIVRNSNGQLFRYTYDGDFYDTGNGDQVGSGFNFEDYFLGDFTADSRTDLLCRNSSGKLYLYQLNTSAFYGLGEVGSGFLNFTDHFVGNWVGDAKDEFIGRLSNGNLLMYKMGSTKFASEGQVGSGFSYEKYFPGNWIANAKTSFITLDASGNMRLHKFNETTKWFDDQGIVGSGFVYEDYCVGDFTGDGIDDLIAIDQNNSMYLYPFKNDTFYSNGGPIAIGNNKYFKEFLVGQWGN